MKKTVTINDFGVPQDPWIGLQVNFYVAYNIYEKNIRS